MLEIPQPPTATMTWRKSKASGSGECVETTCTHEYAWVRDSKNPHGAVLGFTRETWATFISGVRGGRFDGPTSC
jgi:predicted secreted Zn-dependent protease